MTSTRSGTKTDHPERNQAVPLQARYLDDREFEKWLACYADDVVYWIVVDDDATAWSRILYDIALIYY